MPIHRRPGDNSSVQGDSVPLADSWPVLVRNFSSLPERTEPIEFLNKNAMRAMRHIHKRGTGRQSIRHNGLLVDVVLRLIANQDSIFGRRWIYVIQFSFVCDGGNLAGWQRGHSLPLFGRCHSPRLEPSSHQQVFFLRCRAGTDDSALASPREAQRQDHEKNIRKWKCLFHLSHSFVWLRFCGLICSTSKQLSESCGPLPR